MSKWRYYTVEITSASVSELLSVCNRFDCNLENILYIDELRIRANISVCDYHKLYQITVSRCDNLEVIKQKGLFFELQNALHRPVLLIACVLWLMLVLYLPTRILFVRVEGNKIVNSSRIIEAAEQTGIHFGASRRFVRSEKVKNLLLSEIEDLQWAGVNTNGCVAVISVKERSLITHNNALDTVSSIVAKRDGIISSASVTNGNNLCHIGQAVRKGQILVSGYTDCGLSVRAERSEGEIMAFTNRHISAVSPLIAVKRTNATEKKVYFSIQIGKYIIKLHNNSSISDTKCVKLYEQKCLTLPGDFELPVKLIKETVQFFAEQEILSHNMDELSWLNSVASTYLKKDMVSGTIVHSNVNIKLHEDVCFLKGSYTCNEMIGQVRAEKIGEYNG